MVSSHVPVHNTTQQLSALIILSTILTGFTGLGIYSFTGPALKCALIAFNMLLFVALVATLWLIILNSTASQHVTYTCGLHSLWLLLVFTTVSGVYAFGVAYTLHVRSLWAFISNAISLGLSFVVTLCVFSWTKKADYETV